MRLRPGPVHRRLLEVVLWFMIVHGLVMLGWRVWREWGLVRRILGIVRHVEFVLLVEML